MRIYFDNASTTPILPEVSSFMFDIMTNNYGNPSSIHFYGRQSKIIIEDARKVIADGLGVSTGEIFFTSGATEANNMIIYSAINDLNVKHIISCTTEHHCNLHMFDYLIEQNLAEVTLLKTTSEGHIDLVKLEALLQSSNHETMVSLMHGNNEIGTIHDMQAISDLCEKYKVLYHSDAAQTCGKIPINLSDTKVNFLAASAHKFFGPKGVGFVYINLDNMIKPILHGGDQERGMRSGTENIYGIAGMSKAFEIAISDMEKRHHYIQELTTHFINRLLTECEDIKINGSKSNKLINIVNVSFPHTEKAEMLMMNLDIMGICASAGSACASGVENDSHVLEAIGHDPNRKAIRFSFSHLNTIEEVNIVVDKIKTITPVSI